MSKEEVDSAVREEFGKLSLDGKTAFLVEAVFSTAGTAIDEISSRLNGLVDLVTQPASDDESAASETSEKEEAPSGKKADSKKKS